MAATATAGRGDTGGIWSRETATGQKCKARERRLVRALARSCNYPVGSARRSRLAGLGKSGYEEASSRGEKREREREKKKGKKREKKEGGKEKTSGDRE